MQSMRAMIYRVMLSRLRLSQRKPDKHSSANDMVTIRGDDSTVSQRQAHASFLADQWWRNDRWNDRLIVASSRDGTGLDRLNLPYVCTGSASTLVRPAAAQTSS